MRDAVGNRRRNDHVVSSFFEMRRRCICVNFSREGIQSQRQVRAMFFHDSHRQNHQPCARASQSLNFRERNFRKVPHRLTSQVRGAQRSFSASFPIARALFAFNCPWIAARLEVSFSYGPLSPPPEPTPWGKNQKRSGGSYPSCRATSGKRSLLQEPRPRAKWCYTAT